jgi:hypothetical protein
VSVERLCIEIEEIVVADECLRFFSLIVTPATTAAMMRIPKTTREKYSLDRCRRPLERAISRLWRLSSFVWSPRRSFSRGVIECEGSAESSGSAGLSDGAVIASPECLDGSRGRSGCDVLGVGGGCPELKLVEDMAVFVGAPVLK